jgi:hypothetical protein
MITIKKITLQITQVTEGNDRISLAKGGINQQGETARDDTQVTQQTIHVFTVPEL